MATSPRGADPPRINVGRGFRTGKRIPRRRSPAVRGVSMAVENRALLNHQPGRSGGRNPPRYRPVPRILSDQLPGLQPLHGTGLRREGSTFGSAILHWIDDHELNHARNVAQSASEHHFHDLGKEFERLVGSASDIHQRTNLVLGHANTCIPWAAATHLNSPDPPLPIWLWTGSAFQEFTTAWWELYPIPVPCYSPAPW